MPERIILIYVGAALVAVALIFAYFDGRLSWPLAVTFPLYLIVTPHFLTWAWPENRPPIWLRFVPSLVGFYIVAAVIHWLGSS